jgi:hypothetical protein
MDGYTVDEAAEVLGIPGKRVWELITTGVLAASSEGRSGMRVFLQPRTTTEMESSGGDPRGSEATPFRELLTEFRNLTERYGQALLALGEARGEVASLRGRVDLLEARIDVRHAPARIAPVGSWPSAPLPADDEDEARLDELSGQAPPAADQELGLDEVLGEGPSVVEQGIGPEAVSDLGPAAEQLVEADAREPAPAPEAEDLVAAPPAEETEGRSRRKSRSRSGYATPEAIQAALARAEDPTAAELREATEQAALAESRETVPTAVAEPDQTMAEAVAEPESTTAEALAEPEEAHPATVAELEQLADEAEPFSDEREGLPDAESLEPQAPLFDESSPYTTAFEEPDWIIEEDLWRSAATEASEPQAATAVEDEPLPSGLLEDEAPPTADPGSEGSAQLDAIEATLVDALETEVITEPATAEMEGVAEPSTWEADRLDEPASAEPETETAEPAPAPESSASADQSVADEGPAIEAITADVAFSIEAQEPEADVAEAEREEAVEMVGDFDAFMAAADLGPPPSSEPDYAAELEHSTAGWHSATAPPDASSEAEYVAESIPEDEPPAEPAATATPEPEAVVPAYEPDGATDGWDASEMEAIRALLARANAIDREQLEVEASSHPLEADQEELVREIVASGVAADFEDGPDEPVAQPPDLPEGEELIVDLARPDVPAPDAPASDAPAPNAPTSDEPPYSLAPRLELPGSNDLGEAMAALEAIGAEQESESTPPDSPPNARAAPLWPEAERQAWSGFTQPLQTPVSTIESDPSAEPAPSNGAGEEVLAHLDFGSPAFGALPTTTRRSDSDFSASRHDEDEEEPQEGAASRAFRRFRRIFPG